MKLSTPHPFRYALPIVLIAILLNPAVGQAADWPPVSMDSSTAKIEAALSDETVVQFIETPLSDVVEFLEETHDIEIRLDARAMEAAGLGSDIPITRDHRGITLRSALRHILTELDLDYVVRNEVLVITTPERIADEARVQVYNIAPLLDEGNTADDLTKVALTVIESDPAVDVSTFRGLLVVRASGRQHRQVRSLLGLMAAALDVAPAKPKIGQPSTGSSERFSNPFGSDEGAVPFDGEGEAEDPFELSGDAADPFGGEVTTEDDGNPFAD